MTIQRLAMHSMIILLGTTGLQAAAAPPERAKQLYQQSSQSTTTTIIRGGSHSRNDHSIVNIANILNQARHDAGQQASLNISARHLNQPHRLTVGTSGNQANGTVRVDGRPIHTLGSGNSSVNLSPYLSSGQHMVEIVGTMPTSRTIQISLTGPGTQLNHQLRGAGQLSYTLRIIVE